MSNGLSWVHVCDNR